MSRPCLCDGSGWRLMSRDILPVERYNAEIQQRMAGTVWSTGCKSWYLDSEGRNPTLWPDWTWRFRQRTARFNPDDFELTTRAAPAAPEPVTA